jgi:hypothetical protein
VSILGLLAGSLAACAEDEEPVTQGAAADIVLRAEGERRDAKKGGKGGDREEATREEARRETERGTCPPTLPSRPTVSDWQVWREQLQRCVGSSNAGQPGSSNAGQPGTATASATASGSGSSLAIACNNGTCTCQKNGGEKLTCSGDGSDPALPYCSTCAKQ